MNIPKELIVQCLKSPWDFVNKVLYDLCITHFYHTDVGEILAKVLLIGREYSAAIERGKNKIVSISLGNRTFSSYVKPAGGSGCGFHSPSLINPLNGP